MKSLLKYENEISRFMKINCVFMEKRKIFLFSMLALLVMQVWALPPDKHRVTLDVKGVSVETFLDVLKEKSGVNLIYKADMFKGISPVTVKATNEECGAVIRRVLEPKGFTYAVTQGIIVIKKQDSKRGLRCSRVR